MGRIASLLRGSWLPGLIRKAGSFLILAGVISIALFLFGYNLRILAWVDVWGPVAGLGLRGVVIVAGVVFWIMSPRLIRLLG